MSGRQAKKLRREVKNYLKSKHMDNGQRQEVQYSFKQLESYVQLSLFLTGKKPEKIELVENYYNWYIQEIQTQAEAMGLNPGFKGDKPTFLGIPLEKKVTIAVPEIVVPKDVAKDLPNGETPKA